QSQRHLLNPGAVGQPRDRNPDAAWALVDTTARTFELRRAAYDVEAVEWKIRRAGLPDFLGERLRLGA
ncbi:MAG: metallophosphoesterase, partial [Planctomycetota bacterium]|nr:metallophosphoesterase [Planctomycetota bacterium]